MRVVVILLAALCASAPAFAEGEPEGQDPFVDAQGNFVGGLDTSGFVLADGSGWAQVCTAAFDSSGFQADFSVLLGDGTLLVGGIPGLGISTDQGCSFDMVADLAGRHVSSLAVVGGTLFTGTEDNGQPNAIFQSIDGGHQWTQARAPEAGLLIFELVASADGQRIAASGLRVNGAPTVALLVSVDGGISFQDVSAGYAGLTRVRAVTFDSDDTALLLGGFGTDATNPGFVLRAAPPYDAPDTLGNFPSEVRDIAVLNGTRVALAYLARKTFAMGPTDTGFTQVTDKDNGPGSCLFAKPDGSGLVGCGLQGQRTPKSPMFLESTDGVTWTTLVDFPDVHFRTCPQGTVGASACARFIEATQCTDGIDNDADGFTDCDDPDCKGTAACPGTGEGEGEGASSGEGEGEGGTTEPGTCACTGVAAGAPISGIAGLALICARCFRRRHLPVR